MVYSRRLARGQEEFTSDEDLFRVELCHDREALTSIERWPLLIDGDEHQYRRLIKLQKQRLNMSGKSLGNAKQRFDRSEIFCLEVVALLRSLTKRLSDDQSEAFQLCQRILERVEQERGLIKELRSDQGTLTLTETAPMSESSESHSLNATIQEVLKTLSAPSSWFHQCDGILEADFYLDMTKRGLTLLISQLSLFDHEPQDTLNYDEEHSEAVIELCVTTPKTHSVGKISTTVNRLRGDIAYVGELAAHQKGKLQVESRGGGSIRLIGAFRSDSKCTCSG